MQLQRRLVCGSQFSMKDVKKWEYRNAGIPEKS
jgi:hypothetical protein